MHNTLLAMQENIQSTIHSSIQELGDTLLNHGPCQNPLFDDEGTEDGLNPFTSPAQVDGQEPNG